MTLFDFINTSKNDILNNSIKRAVKYPENFEITNTNIINNWYEFDIYGIKSKSAAKVRVEC